MRNEITYFRALQLIALDSVENGGNDAFYRKVCRWYSKTFSTPLSEVEAIPETQLFLTYYEDTFDAMYSGSEEEQKQYEIFRSKIVANSLDKTDEQDDEDWANAEIAKIKAEENKKKPKTKEEVKQLVENTAKELAELASEGVKKATKPDPNIDINEEEFSLDSVQLMGEDPSIPLD